jgi:hypothetical protein
MTLDGGFSFARVIEDHLELKRRNSALEGEMPLDRYKTDDPFQNHPLFKSEEQARLEETLSGEQPAVLEEDLVLAWAAPAPAEETDPMLGEAEGEKTLWDRARDFDWGD